MTCNFNNTNSDFYTKIKNAFNNSAFNYDNNAVLQKEVGLRLIERLDYFTIQPKNILDLGMGTGAITAELVKKYPNTHLIGIDVANNMLKVAKQNNLKDIYNYTLIQADINKIPLASNSVDLIFSNFSLQWSENITDIFKECLRILKTDGLLFFSIPGPDTLYELRSAFHHCDPNHHHVNNFIDMHNLGDILIQTNFGHPVMDSEVFTLTYSKVSSILKDLKAIGANTKLDHNYRKSLFSKTLYKTLEHEFEQYRRPDGKLPLTYEVIYGHAFKTAKPVKKKHPEISEVMVPIEKIIKNNLNHD